MVDIIPFIQNEDELLAITVFMNLCQGIPNRLIFFYFSIGVFLLQIHQQSLLKSGNILYIGATGSR